jgi:hypothetical protein
MAKFGVKMVHIPYSLTSLDRKHCTNIHIDCIVRVQYSIEIYTKSGNIFIIYFLVIVKLIFYILFFLKENTSGIDNSCSVEWVFKCGLLEDEYLGYRVP